MAEIQVVGAVRTHEPLRRLERKTGFAEEDEPTVVGEDPDDVGPLGSRHDLTSLIG
jgi:hypothetical protein